MKIKYIKKIIEYKYLLMFDLATHVTGICLWNITDKKPVSTFVLKISPKEEDPEGKLYDEIDKIFMQLDSQGINKKDILVYQEAMPPQLRGGSSTVQTFLSLAKSHAILNLYTYKNNIAIYDYIGVYPASTHSYFKKINNLEAKQKIDKQQIKEYVRSEYGLLDLTFDESDAVFLAKTFCEIKWNNDIKDKIKELKKHLKELSQESSKNKILQEIKKFEEFLQ